MIWPKADTDSSVSFDNPRLKTLRREQVLFRSTGFSENILNVSINIGAFVVGRNRAPPPPEESFAAPNAIIDEPGTSQPDASLRPDAAKGEQVECGF